MKLCFTKAARAIVGGWKFRIHTIRELFSSGVLIEIMRKYALMKCQIDGGVPISG
jgi:hypothetical protein